MPIRSESVNEVSRLAKNILRTVYNIYIYLLAIGSSQFFYCFRVTASFSPIPYISGQINTNLHSVSSFELTREITAAKNISTVL